MANQALEFNELRLRNFLSFGAKEVVVPLGGDHITVVLGENRDTGGEDSRNGCGKAQPLDSKILTPYGWSTMGEMEIGSCIISGTGKPTIVTGVHPRGIRDVFAVTFSDGRVVKCCGDHLWKIWNRNGSNWGWSVQSTFDIIKHREKFPGASGRTYVPLFPGEMKRTDTNVPIDPYLLGILIGDGNFTSGVRFTTKDEAIVETVRSILPDGVEVRGPNKLTYTITDGSKGFNPVSIHLRSLGMWDSRAWEKTIPDAYMEMSITQTKHLLQGLLDSDGTVDANGSVSFTTTSPVLASQVQNLVWKIGGIAKITELNKLYTHNGKKRQGQPSYRVGIRHPQRETLFRLQRKIEKLPIPYQYQNSLRLEIIDIKPICSEEVQCITVSDPDHLYVTDNYVVTHNSAIIDALCYALFGKVVRGISNQKLINKLSPKGSMIVSVEFTKDEYRYLVERTERPSKLFLFRKKLDDDSDFKAKDGRKLKHDIARGKNETTDQIVGILGFDITLFEYLVANTSESLEFFRLPEDKRRDVIEHLFGFTIMTEKAKLLKDERKEKNKDLLTAESSIEATKQANSRIEAQVKELEAKSKAWEKKKADTIAELQETIKTLEAVDVKKEIEMLNLATDAYAQVKELEAGLREIKSEVRRCQNELKEHERQQKRDDQYVTETQASLAKLEEETCPTCNQHWVADPEYKKTLAESLEEAVLRYAESKDKELHVTTEMKTLEKRELELKTEISNLNEALRDIDRLNLTYGSVEEAASAGATLKALREQLEKVEVDENPHVESVTKFREEAIKKVDESEIKDLRLLIAHYNYLIDLLTKKDSFLRKLIIDRWMPILNKRIAYWLEILELPHIVAFQPDLTVSITDYHEEFDFGNLSKGERNRVRIALNFAFQDVFEFMNYSINLLAVDELIDSGICPRGAENAVRALKETCTKKGKRAFLITHRDDIAARVEDVMKIIKENRMSKIEYGA